MNRGIFPQLIRDTECHLLALLQTNERPWDRPVDCDGSGGPLTDSKSCFADDEIDDLPTQR